MKKAIFKIASLIRFHPLRWHYLPIVRRHFREKGSRVIFYMEESGVLHLFLIPWSTDYIEKGDSAKEVDMLVNSFVDEDYWDGYDLEKWETCYCSSAYEVPVKTGIFSGCSIVVHQTPV